MQATTRAMPGDVKTLLVGEPDERGAKLSQQGGDRAPRGNWAGRACGRGGESRGELEQAIPYVYIEREVSKMERFGHRVSRAGKHY